MGPDQGLVLAESLANQEVKDRFLDSVTNLFKSKKGLKKNKPMLLLIMRFVCQMAMPLLLFCSPTFNGHTQTLIAGWDFEGITLPEGSTGTSRSGFFASAGTQVGVAEASGVHADRRTGWATPSGNGSGKSLSATSWNVGAYFQFRVSSLGFSGLTLAWDQIRDSGASSNFDLSYSIDGANFTSFASYAVNSSATFADNSSAGWWSGSTSATNTSYFYDLGTVTGLDNQSDVFFRLVATSLSTDTRHRGAIDNVIVTGVPEPSAVSLVFLGLGGWMAFRRRRQISG